MFMIFHHIICYKQVKILNDQKKYFLKPDVDYKCPICEKTMQELYSKKQIRLKVWVLDHCHKTNTFKGWLCHNCNTKIGNENKQFFKNAISYLEKHEERINENNT